MTGGDFHSFFVHIGGGGACSRASGLSWDSVPPRRMSASSPAGKELDEPLLRGSFSPVPLPETSGERGGPAPAARSGRAGKKSLCWLALIMTLLVTMGCVNFILVKAMYDAFGTSGAFFANQGVNLLYVVYGGAVVAYKVAATNDIDAEQRSFPHCRFFGLALLDAFGTFFTAMGASFTP